MIIKGAWEKEKDKSKMRVKGFSKTRFIHIYLMFRSFWLNREILPRLLLSAREKGFTVASTLPPFSEDDWNFVEESLSFLEPFFSFVTACETETNAFPWRFLIKYDRPIC